jgi:hypothetical protein
MDSILVVFAKSEYVIGWLLLIDRVKLSIAVWFDSTFWNENRKPNRGLEEKWSVQFKLNVVFCGFRFELVRFTVLILDWFGYEYPYFREAGFMIILFTIHFFIDRRNNNLLKTYAYKVERSGFETPWYIRR